jgi:hypothetical protein
MLAAAIVTALVFALHPLRVESVAWVSERKDVLYAFFYLLSVLTYLRYAVKDARGALFYTASVLFFACSLMSKPMAVTLPLVLIILDYYPLRRIGTGIRNGARSLIDKAPFFILALSVSLATVSSHHGGRLIMDSGIHPTGERILLSAFNYFFYLYKTLVPMELAPIYPYPTDVSLLSPAYAGSLLLFIAVTTYALFSIKKSRLFTAAWLYYVITLLPVIGIFTGGGDRAAADRYTYLACLAPVLLVGLLAGAAFKVPARDRLRGVTAAVVILAACALSLLTVKQTAIWKDTLTF